MKIIATDIANLTDARYFAAWGVDMMCYTIDEGAEGSMTIAQVKEIVDWVEGPATGIKMTGLTIPDTFSDIGVKVSAAILGPFIDRADLPSKDVDMYRICTLTDISQDTNKLILTLDTPVSKLSREQEEMIDTLTDSREVYIDGSFGAADLDKIRSLGAVGIVLKGGEEEKVGFKSFDELDEVLEAIFD